LGLAAAASVELYLRITRCCWRRELEARIGAALLARSWRAQHCAAYRQDIDMVGDGETDRGSVGKWRVSACWGVGRSDWPRWSAAVCRESRRFFRPLFEKSTGPRLIGWSGRSAGGRLEHNKSIRPASLQRLGFSDRGR
jgi:hypothetical protein